MGALIRVRQFYTTTTPWKFHHDMSYHPFLITPRRYLKGSSCHFFPFLNGNRKSSSVVVEILRIWEYNDLFQLHASTKDLQYSMGHNTQQLLNSGSIRIFMVSYGTRDLKFTNLLTQGSGSGINLSCTYNKHLIRNSSLANYRFYFII